MVCPRCGAESPADFAFCPRCGTALEAVPAAAPDRRVISILFCDVVGSTAVAEHLDPEVFLEIMNGAFQALIPPITRHGGIVARLMGDAVLAFFGAPVGHEDDPERAIRAALDIVENVRLYGESVARERGIAGFGVRAGINTGLVVVGSVGAGGQIEYTAMGDAVNLAARMQSAAPPGGVLITHDTYRQVRGLFDVVPQPPLSVKGHTGPVRTYLVKQAKALAFPTENRGVEGVATRMAGRDKELATLLSKYADATESGQPRMITILGEAGIGKSRLLDEFVGWVDLRPEVVYYWRGRATRATEETPYGLLRDLFARRFAILDSDTVARALARFRTGLRGILEEDQADLAGHLAGFDFSASPYVRGLLGSPAFGQIAVAALRQALRVLWDIAPDASEGDEPVLILLEDIHWADDASLDLIAALIAEAPTDGGTRLMLVASARPDFLERRPGWGEDLLPGVSSRMELGPLSRRNSRALVADLLQRVPDPPDVLQNMLVDGADGNPFFLEELVKVLIEDGAIETGAAEWRINSQRLGQVRLPPTLTAVLQARLDALPPAERLVLQRGSIAGRQFWDGLVSELAPEVADVDPPLNALMVREMVFRYEQRAFAGVLEYTFKHAMLQQVTYETVLLRTRRDCHARVARWIEGRAGERLGEYLALIASHYRMAEENVAAGGWYIRAGQRAAALGANGDARGFFTTALELLPPAEQALRWRALSAYGEVVGVLGDSAARQAADAQMLSLAEQMGDANLLAEAHYRRGYYLQVLSRYDEAAVALDAALALSEQAGNDEVRTATLAVKVLTLTRLGRMVDAQAISGEALAAAETLGEPHLLARALTNVAIYFAAAGDLARAARLMARQAELTEQIGNLVGQAVSLGNLGYYYLLLGRHEAARQALEQALSLSEVIGARRERLYNQLNLGLACWRTGDLTSARTLLQEAIPALEALGDTFARACGQVYLGLALEACGELSPARVALEDAQRTMEAIGVRGYSLDAQAGLLRCRIREGDQSAVRSAASALWAALADGMEGMEFPLLACETCARAFELSGERALAKDVLEIAHAALMEQADKISDPEWRQSFLENIAEHRALVGMLGAAGPGLAADTPAVERSGDAAALG